MATDWDAPELAGIHGAVAALTALGPVDVAFAGAVDHATDTFVLGQFHGARTGHLQGLVSPAGAGLGGKCVDLRRPVYVGDYAAARGITHQYDRPVASEGLRAIFALPVQRDGRVRAVVYGACRRPTEFGERLLGAAATAVARALRVREPQGPFTDVGAASPDTVARLREMHAEIRAIAADVADPVLRERLLRLVTERPRGATAVWLAPRERDVLCEVAVGCANAEIAERLGLSVETVKSYLKSAMTRLGCHNRSEAVHRARECGWLP